MWSGFVWLRIMFSRGLFWTWYWTNGFHKTWGVSSARDYLLLRKHIVRAATIHRELWEMVERGLPIRGISLYGSSVRGTWRGAPLLGALVVTKGRLWGRESFFMGAQLGNLEWAHLLGLWDMVERGSGGGVSVCLWELCEGNLEGGLPCRAPWRIFRKGSENGHLFS